MLTSLLYGLPHSFLSESLGSPHSVIFKKLQPPPINKGKFISEWPYTFTYEKTANGSTSLFFCSLKPLGGSKVDSAFCSSKVNQISTKYSWRLVKSKQSPWSGSIFEAFEPCFYNFFSFNEIFIVRSVCNLTMM